MDDVKIGDLVLSDIGEGIIVSDYSYELGDSMENIFISREDVKELIKYLEGLD